jgi:hypothetical protein
VRSAAATFAEEDMDMAWAGGKLYVNRPSLGFQIVEVDMATWSVHATAGTGESIAGPDDVPAVSSPLQMPT